MILASNKKETPLLIKSPSGRLEGVVEQMGHEENAPSKFISIICHPHPLQGGNMNNKVVTTLSRAFLDIGAISIRFNYRGVGKSEGSFGNVAGEVEDALSVLNFAKQNFPGYRIAVSGFSFGGSVAIRVAQQEKIDQLITIAPALYLINYDLNIGFNFPWLLVQGWEDEVIEIAATLNWCNTLKVKPEVWCVHASHFFHGKLVILKKKLVDYLMSGV